MTPNRPAPSHARPTAPEELLIPGIRRDPETAAAAPYDLIVIGGGIQGVSILLEAARRGLKALLLERADYGGATTWANLRIIHGGLRYLQSLDIPRLRQSVGERHWFLSHFPDLVRPLACLMPLYDYGLRRPGVFRVALALNEVLSRRTGAGAARLPLGHVLDAAETARLFPRVDRVGLHGGALWYDAVMLSPERVVMEMLHWACARGGRALNYVMAERLLLDGAKVCGVEAYDRVNRQTLPFAGARVVNATGPWSRALAARLDRDLPDLFRPSLGFNLLLERAPIAEVAVAVAPKAPGARTYFVLPWKGRILAGTYHATLEPRQTKPIPSEAQVAQFLGDLNAAVPGLGLAPEAVVRVYAGLLPARRCGSPEAATRDVVHDHGAARGPQGLYSVSGVKFTTARLLAEKTLRRVFPDRGMEPANQAVGRPPPLVDLSGESLERAFAPLAGPPDLVTARLRALVAHESVVTFEDLLLRRLDSTASVANLDAGRRQAERLLGCDIETEVNCAAGLQLSTDCVGDDETELPPP
jgi:glycerol-3-phosphate dehydrogenase